MKLRKMLTLFFFLCIHSTSAQVDSAGRKLSYYHNYFTIDTMKFYSKKIMVLYTLKRTNNLEDRFFKRGDLIFNNSANKVSKLFIIDQHSQIDSISTIPIDNIVIDDSREIIICLSRAEASPYNIVLYNFKGKLLFKKKILPLELQLDSVGYVQFQNFFPTFFEYANRNKQIFHADNLYYIDLTYWHFLSISQQKKIKEFNWIKSSHYFPALISESFDGVPPIELSKYTNFYSQTDPFYEFETSSSDHLTGIILNDEFGGKVKIPFNDTISSR